MTIEEVKNKFLNIIYKQNNLKGRVLDDFSEATEAYVEIYNNYPSCYYIPVNIKREETINKIIDKYECFFPGAYEIYKENENNEFKFDKIIYDSNILTKEGFICIDGTGISIYTNNDIFKEDIIKCIIKKEIVNPCEVYWVSNGQQGFGASKLELKDGKFNIKNHYNDDFDYDKINNFINSEESGLIILHGEPGTGNKYFYFILSFKL